MTQQTQISFQGICTHFRNGNVQALGDVVHRVVLVNATSQTTIAGITIPPHFPQIKIAGAAAVPLQGVHLTLIGPGSPLSYSPDYFTKTPSLETLMSQIEPLPDPSLDLILGEAWPIVAAYIDINIGVLSARLNDSGAAMATLAIDTDAEVLVSATPFPGSPVLNPFNFEFILPPGSLTEISNQALPDEEMKMTRGHFFLHYLLGNHVPSAPQTPPNPSPPIDEVSPEAGGGRDLVGSGCSDSNYP